jgi:hypothetical protein
MIDQLREQPVETLTAWFGGAAVARGQEHAAAASARLPLPIRIQLRMLVTGPESGVLRVAVRRLSSARSHATR